MRTASVADVKAKFSAYVDAVKGGPVVVTKHGRPAAILVRAPEDPDDLERFMIANNPVFQRIIHEASRQQGVPHDEFWQRLEAGYRRAAPPGRASTGAPGKSRRASGGRLRAQ